MKLKIGMLAAGLVAAVVSFGAFAPTGTAHAEERDAVGEVDALLFIGADFQAPRWLRHSIVVCGAKTTHLEVEQVIVALRHGHSLKQIGLRAGVRPVALEHGILRCEQAVLARMVENGDLEPGEARRIFRFLESQITRIINFQWNPDDAALTDVAPSDVAPTDAVTDAG